MCKTFHIHLLWYNFTYLEFNHAVLLRKWHRFCVSMALDIFFAGKGGVNGEAPHPIVLTEPDKREATTMPCYSIIVIGGRWCWYSLISLCRRQDVPCRSINNHKTSQRATKRTPPVLTIWSWPWIILWSVWFTTNLLSYQFLGYFNSSKYMFGLLSIFLSQ